jgi:uncharacterized membrane protein
MKQELEKEVLVNHKRETRMQSIGMLLGIAIGVFVAMNLIDVVKSVDSIVATQKEILHEHEDLKNIQAYNMDHRSQIDEDILVMWHEINGMKTILIKIEEQLYNSHPPSE